MLTCKREKRKRVIWQRGPTRVPPQVLTSLFQHDLSQPLTLNWIPTFGLGTSGLATWVSDLVFITICLIPATSPTGRSLHCSFAGIDFVLSTQDPVRMIINPPPEESKKASVSHYSTSTVNILYCLIAGLNDIFPRISQREICEHSSPNICSTVNSWRFEKQLAGRYFPWGGKGEGLPQRQSKA